MKDKMLYLECYSGISGDMTVAALLDLGADKEVLLEGLKSLQVDGYHIVIGRRTKNSIDACDFDVVLDDHDHDHNHGHPHEHCHDLNIDNNHSRDLAHNHDHFHEHDHNHNHEHSHNHEHTHNHDYNHDHGHTHEHDNDHIHPHDHNHSNHHHHDHTHHHDPSNTPATITGSPRLVLGHHEHRNLYDINQIIEQSSISQNAKDLAKKIFHIIAVAEAKAHAKPLEEVHFHEVGAIDSIVDIVATAICLDNLNIQQVIVSELYEGTGTIKCQHGMLPIPVPAVVNISAEHKLPLNIINVKGELVTPTGAAIVAAIKTGDTLPADFKIHRIGLGAGKRNYSGASGILRAMLIEDRSSSSELPTDRIWVMEANIDDCSGEALAAAMDLLFKEGARDVYYTPIFMKKNRPAYLLGVICTVDKVSLLEEIIFTHTTTIGIRKYEAIRSILPREQRTIPTPYGDAQVKVCTYKDRTFYYPEYESVKQLCSASGKDYLSMYHIVQSLATSL